MWHSYARQDHDMNCFIAANKRIRIMHNRKPRITRLLDFLGNYRYYRKRGLSMRMSFEMAGRVI